MTTTQQNHVPALRFPEFNGDWKIKRLEEIGEKIGDGIHSTPIYDQRGRYYFINGNNLVHDKIDVNEATKKVNDSEYCKHKVNLSKNTILLSINGTIGNLAFYKEEKVILGKSVCYINLRKRENKNFIFNILQSEKVKRFFDSELTGSTIMNLSLQTVRNTKLHLPETQEQQKIAAFLSSVDTKIEQLNKKKALWEQYKKGMMQTLFSQEIRFKDERGKNYPDWEEKRLGEIFTIRYGKDHKNLHDGDIPVMGTGGVIRYVDSILYNQPSVLIGRKGTIDEPQYIEQPFWSVDTLFYTEIEPFYIPFFIFLVVLNINWKRYNEATGVPSLNANTIINIKVDIPCEEEQLKIANILSAIDKKIELVTGQLKHAQTFKKGLLQQMFI